MKTLTLFLILISLSVICSGQNPNFKTPKEVQKIEYEHSLQKVNRFDKEFKKADSAFKWSDYTIATNTSNSLIIQATDETSAKIIISSKGVVMIKINNFKVCDTIWISNGKRKVGIPAYKFLEYFKDEPISGGLFWNGSTNMRGL